LSPRFLITGGSGFVGTHLVAHLSGRSANVAVLGTGVFARSADVIGYRVDVRDSEAVRAAVQEFRPTHVCHLAAISSVAESWRQPRLAYEVNVLGTFNVLEAAMTLSQPARVLNISTAQVYAASSQPLSETSSLGPENPYAASKAMAELLAVQYRKVAEGGVITARSFNHAGPRQTPDYVLSSIAKQFAEMEAGMREPTLIVGNTHVRRDFTDVRDVVEAYFELLIKGTPGDIYNVCSGRAQSIRELIDELVSISGLKIRIESQEARRRAGEVEVVCGSPEKIRSTIDWRPKIPLRQTLKDLLDYWREKIAEDKPTSCQPAIEADPLPAMSQTKQ